MRVYFDHLRFALFERSALRVRGALCACSALCVHLWAFLVSGVLFLPGVLFAAETVAESGLEHYSQREWSNAAGNTMDGASGNALFKASDTATGRFTDRADSLVKLNFVMDLFVQRADESTIEPDSAVIAQRVLYLKFLKQKAEADSLRSAMQTSLAEKRYDDFKKTVADAEIFEKENPPHQVIWESQKIWIKYFIKDFDFLSDVDSVSFYKHYASRYGYYAEMLRSQMDSGSFEETLKEVENESDRVFIHLLLMKMTERQDNISELILKYKSKLTKKKQLDYLVENYWDVTGIDKRIYGGISIGVPYSLYLGDISKRMESGFGTKHGLNGVIDISFVYNDFLHEFIIDWNYGDYNNVDSLDFYDSNVDYNLGYTFLNAEYLRLYSFISLGYGKNMLICKSHEDDDCLDKVVRDYFSFGAGGMADVLFTKRRPFQLGIRLRTGIKNVWADNLVNASGYRWYGSVELLFLYYKKGKLEFDY